MRFLRVLPMVASLAAIITAATMAVVSTATPASAENVFAFTERSSYSDSVSVNHHVRRSDLGASRGAARQQAARDDDDEEAAPRRRTRRSEQRQRNRPGRVVRSADDQQYEAPRSRRRGARTASLGSSYATSGGTHHGLASFYWQPQRVASGGWFNPNAMTAAHKTLPFGTRVRVTHVGNGRSVVVRINDRGPYVRGRIIDLSKAAAGVIGMVGQGVAQIRMEVLGR
jgi:rare lipoprotein A